MITQNETLILGIGNSLLSDEGAGIHALNLLQSEYTDIPNLTFVDGGTLSFTLAEPMAEHDNLIVVDAARFGESPGTVKCFEGAEMDRYLTGNRSSVHEVGLVDLIRIAGDGVEAVAPTDPIGARRAAQEKRSISCGGRLGQCLRR